MFTLNLPESGIRRLTNIRIFVDKGSYPGFGRTISLLLINQLITPYAK